MISMQRFLLMRMPVPAEMMSSRLGLPEYLTDVACSPLVPPPGVSNVVCRRKCPFAVFTEKTEVLGVIVFVGAYDIENHSTEHLFHLCRILSKIAGQGKEIYIIYTALGLAPPELRLL